jgi:N-acetylglucosamine-6-phosphate deacetylase
VANTNIYIADRVFTGEKWLSHHAVVTENKRIREIIPVSHLPDPGNARHFPGCFIAPAFIDLQIYGAGGKLLAAFPDTDALQKLKEYNEQGGTAYCLPTVATNTREVFYQCIDAVRQYWKQGGEGVPGLHLEGPWINPEKRGAHIESLIHSPDPATVTEMLEYGKGVIKMITLAPECCTPEIIKLILSYNIIVSAGHSNATYAQARTGFDSGIRAVTHLFNAMSPLQHRQPGLAGAAMDDERVMASIIPDGYHVDFAVIRIAKKVMKERLFVITDAVTETQTGYYPHQKAGDKYEAGGILSGSALTMTKAVANLVHHCETDLAEALRMCSLYPARVLQLADTMGMIAPGYEVSMAVLSNQLSTVSLLRG